MHIKITIALATSATVLLFGTGTARAQAFTQERGHGRVITSLLWSESRRGFDDDGHAVDIADYQKTEIYFAAEYGIIRRTDPAGDPVASRRVRKGWR